MINIQKAIMQIQK